MKFSIITATYNCMDTVKDCLHSVYSQSHPRVEHIIIDGASSDSTLDLIRRQPTRASRVISEPDRGIYDALNKGIRHATGNVIGFLHADDELWDEKTLEQINQTFKLSGADVIYGGLVYVSKDQEKRIIRTWKSEPFHPGKLQRGWMPAHPTVFMKREVYDKHGQFNLDYKISADYEFILRVFKDTSLKIVNVPNIITKMRIGGTSNNGLRNIIRKSSEDFRAMRSNKLPFPVFVLLSKNISKIPQFFI
ncbi:glycosyltransferase family 2 protein [Saccharicrinis sp. FJH54]|uniref:glycosyltransferase family 2 protein n=1 Tax=Saccharicrinis sp. FJH54 TaxID=3344665 RepID=UPI0035D4BA98